MISTPWKRSERQRNENAVANPHELIQLVDLSGKCSPPNSSSPAASSFALSSKKAE